MEGCMLFTLETTPLQFFFGVALISTVVTIFVIYTKVGRRDRYGIRHPEFPLIFAAASYLFWGLFALFEHPATGSVIWFALAIVLLLAAIVSMAYFVWFWNQ